VATVGDVLRSERLRQGLQVSAIAATTKIPPNLLEAIEAGQFDLLPGGAYRRNFLRQYAHALGLDEEATIAAFHEQCDDPLVALPSPPPVRPSEKLRLPGTLLALIVSILIYRAVVSTPATPDTGIAKTAPPVPSAVEPAQSAARSAQREPTQAEAARSDPGRPLRVAFSVTEPVWVSVKCDGTETFTGTLEGTQTKTFEASRQVTVVLGNAGGLAIRLNERPLGLLGAHGETQILELTARGVRRVSRRPSAAPGGDGIPQ
jgi:cytoskeletal protein RodZ